MAISSFPDGVSIEIAGVDAAAAADPDDILGDGGTVSYSATNHTLYLDGAELTANKTAGHLAGIYIDAGLLTDELIVQIYSGNYVEATNVPAIWYKGGVGMRITGADISNFLNVRTQGADDVVAVLCADDHTFANPKPICIEDIAFTVSNEMSGAGGVYPALYTEFYVLYSCKIEVETFEGIDPIVVDDALSCEEHSVMLMDNSYSPSASVKGVPFWDVFPVYVDGVQMCDGLDTDVDGFYYMDQWTLSSIKDGSIVYDPATKTVYLRGLSVEARTDNDFALIVGDGGSEELTVIADGLWYEEVYLTGIGAKSNGLQINSNTVFDINGHDVEIYSHKQQAIDLNANLTFMNSQASGTLSIIANDGVGISGGGELTLDHCVTSIKAVQEICTVADIHLNAVDITDPSSYKIGGGYILDDTDMTATNGQVDFELTAHKLSVKVLPKDAAGSVEAKNASDVVLPLPYEYSANEDVTLTATPATGWDFIMWQDLGYDENPRTVSLDKSYNTDITAQFSRRIESNAVYYSVTSDGYVYELDPKLRNYALSTPGELGIASGNALRRAVFADGMIYYIEENLSEYKQSLWAIEFDGTVGAGVQLVAMQDDYYPIYAMAYSATDNVIYAIAAKKATTTDVLLKVALSDGHMDEIADLDAMLVNSVRDIAVNAAGDIYVLAETGFTSLYTLDKTNALASYIGDIDEIFGLPSYYEANMTFDPETDELLLAAGAPGQFLLVDPATADADWIAENYMSTSGFFALNAAPKPKHTITVEVASGDESKGDVNINGGAKSGEFEEGATITLNAVANTGYAFDKWNDDNTEENRSFVVGTMDMTFVASFKVDDTPTHTITVAVAAGQEAMGDVDINGGAKTGEFPEGKKITLNAKANSGYKFVKWDDENTDATRSFTVGTEDKTFTASFEEAPVPVGYPVTICGLQLDEEHATLIAGTDLTGVLKAGFITYDPETNTLTLNNVELEYTGENTVLSIDGGEAKTKVNIVIVGNCKITASKNAIGFYDSSMITLSGEGKLDIKAGIAGINLKKANLTIEGLALTVDAVYGIVGNDEAETLIVKGAPISVKGTSGSILELTDMELKYCDFKSGYDFKNNQVEKGGSLATDAVELDIWPMLTVKTVEDGTATFTLSSKKHDDEFTNKGWFEDGDVVTISAEIKDGYVFGHWKDDADWKDKKTRMKADRKFDKGSGNETLTMLCYYEAQSDADWFGINDNEFVKFSFSSNAENVARASNSLTDVLGGDFADGKWVYADDGDVLGFSFSGSLKDGASISDKYNDKYNKKSISTDVTDMAYDILGAELYAVAGSKLIKVTTSDNKEVGVFKLDDVETDIVAIAFNADGTLYALGLGDGTEGALYTAEVGKEMKLKPVGKKENNGKIGMKVDNKPQSIAFDPVTGELFWGAADYIRVIDLSKMKTHIAGDLDQKDGAQGYIKSLHRAAVAVEVTVEVDKDQAEWGYASVGDESTTAKIHSASAYFIEGSTATISATANEGYHFVEWVNADNKKDTHEEATYEFEAEEITYIAVFAEGSEGIQSITIDPTKKVQKVLIDGTIYIFRDGRVYTVTGERME